MTLPATITAAVAPSAIDKVGRLFNGSPADVLHELLQNARRAGATAVDIAVSDSGDHPALIVRDDGRGIDDPRMLLALGASDWSDKTRASEDPAGMGVFSMAGLRVEYRSWSATAGRGWRAMIEGDAWSGRKPVAVAPFEIHSGTEVVIDLPPAWEAQLDRAVAAVTRYCPLAVSFRGVPCERKDWLAGALAIDHWRGSRIGVFHEPGRHSTESTLNFHGVTVSLPLPSIGEVDRGLRWSVKVDIGDTPELQLVLPARKEVVQTPFIGELRQACESAIFRAIAKGGAHRLPFKHCERARALGVELGEADPMLYGWTPATAYSADRASGAQMRRPLIRICGFEPSLEQTLARAIARADDLFLPLADEQSGFEGYEWYDALERLVDLRVHVRQAGTEQIIDCEEQASIASGRADEIVVEIDIEAANGTKRTIALPTDIAIIPVDDYGGDLDNIRLLVTPDPEIDVPTLVGFLTGAAFCPSDDSDSDSYGTQRDHFEREALELARTHLISADAAIVGRAADRVRDHICWLVPEGRTLVMTVRRDGVCAELGDVSAAVDGVAEFARTVLALTHIDSDAPATMSDALAAIRALAAARHHDMG